MERNTCIKRYYELYIVFFAVVERVISLSGVGYMRV